MEIRILDSILHGELKPWLLDVSDKRHYAGLVKSADKETDSYTALNEQLKSLLVNYPALQKYLKSANPKQNIKTQPNFYSADIPKYSDIITQYYYLIITKEIQRTWNAFIIESEDWNDQIDINFHSKNILKSIRVLASQVNEELVERSFNTDKFDSNSHIHYALLLLKNVLVGLFFDIQEYFKEYVKQQETEETFSINYFGSNQYLVRIKPTPALIRFRLNKLVEAPDYNKLDALELLKSSVGSELKEQRAAIENFILLKNSGIVITELDQLTNTNTIKSYLEDLKTEVNNKINKSNLGHQRLMVINDEIETLDFISDSTNNKLSIPLLYYNWLIQLKEMYQQNANAVFSSEETAKLKADKLKAPLTKKDKATMEQNKLYATEHLSFLSGHNRMNEKIMPDKEFKRLLEYTFYLIEKEKLPKDIISIPQIGFASNAIRYTFYKIHEYLYGTQSIKQDWINFLHEVFTQFKNTSKSTTKAKFSTKPPSYDADLNSMSR